MKWLKMDNEYARQEIVKCVVVGDTAVGKTRLICARACNAYLTLAQVFTTHIPTVWAVDQYRIHKEVLRRSWKVIDGVNVSLRLWDTFGDHDKDRRFAYGRSDVVLLCFSVSNQLSLRNCKTKWLSEIRHFCPHAPIVLVGCKNDFRHIYRDEAFLELYREKMPYVRNLRECDMTTREQGREVAKEIGAEYYESSSLTQYGINELFENVLRVALLSRRQNRFWVKSLKNVRNPLLQMPYCPPKPHHPQVRVQDSPYEREVASLLQVGHYPDVRLVVGNEEFFAHKFILAAGSAYFHQIFISSLVVGRSENEKVETVTTFQWLSPPVMQCLLRFLYTGAVHRNMEVNLSELMEVANFANIAELKTLLEKHQKEYDYSTYDDEEKYRVMFRENLTNICLKKELFTDVTFILDDGKFSAHRSILMARSEVMTAMFNGAFKESTSQVVTFPGVTLKTFKAFLRYVYTDKIDESVNIENCLDIIGFANRLCLPHLVSMVESHIAQDIEKRVVDGEDLTTRFFALLETCQMHNAFQLSDLCQYYIMINYQEISLKSLQLLRNLHPENQAHLNKNRWPPVQYLKEFDFYERCVREQQHAQKPAKVYIWKRATRSVNTCLWFWGKGNNESSTQYVLSSEK